MRSPIPSRLSRTKKCPRCGLRYSKNESTCPHCDGLSDDEVRMIKKRRKHSDKDNFDRLLLYVAALIVLVIIIKSI